MNQELSVFHYKTTAGSKPLSSIKIDGESWFVANEICDAMGYANPRDAIKKHCRVVPGVAKRDMNTSAGLRSFTIINEANLYLLIFSSKKQKALRFTDWVIQEVLPTIRRTGSYSITQQVPAPRPKPAFLSLYYNNMHTMPLGGFTVGYMTFHLLYVRLIAHNHRIADAAPDGTRIRPDRSISPRFQRYLDKHYKSVAHLHKPIKFRDMNSSHQEQTVKLYDNLLLTIFVNYFENVWLKEVAPDYFRGKDDGAILAIERLMAVPAPKQIGYTSALKQSA